MDRRERVLELSTRINTLRAELAEAESEFDSLLAPAERKTRSPRVVVAQDGRASGSIDERVPKILKRSGREFSITGLHSQMKDVALASLRAAVSRLASRNVIERVRHGIYRAKEDAG